MDNNYFNILGTDTEVSYWFNGVPKGGYAGTVLTKLSNKDYDMGWKTKEYVTTILTSLNEKPTGIQLNDDKIYSITINYIITGLDKWLNTQLNNVKDIVFVFGNIKQKNNYKIYVPNGGIHFSVLNNNFKIYCESKSMLNGTLNLTIYYTKVDEE